MGPFLIFTIKIADNLVPQVFAKFIWDIPVSAPKGLMTAEAVN